jgi:hypothetical protein
MINPSGSRWYESAGDALGRCVDLAADRLRQVTTVVVTGDPDVRVRVLRVGAANTAQRAQAVGALGVTGSGHADAGRKVGEEVGLGGHRGYEAKGGHGILEFVGWSRSRSPSDLVRESGNSDASSRYCQGPPAYAA